MEQQKPHLHHCEDELLSSWMAKNKSFSITFVESTDGRQILWDCEDGIEKVDVMPKMKVRWDKATLRARSSGIEAIQILLDTWFLRLAIEHSRAGRKYHTLIHLEEMFGYLDLLHGPFEDADDDEALILATFFHDAVYDATLTNNEEESAALYREFVNTILAAMSSNQLDDQWKMLWCSVDHDRVERYILETRTHSVSNSSDTALQIFIDADMAVLGKDEDAYDRYASLIRQEYLHIPKETYCIKRSEILSSFLLQANFIFASERMRSAMEGRSRSNLRREIEMLKAGEVLGEGQRKIKHAER